MAVRMISSMPFSSNNGVVYFRLVAITVFSSIILKKYFPLAALDFT